MVTSSRSRKSPSRKQRSRKTNRSGAFLQTSTAHESAAIEALFDAFARNLARTLVRHASVAPSTRPQSGETAHAPTRFPPR